MNYVNDYRTTARSIEIFEYHRKESDLTSKAMIKFAGEFCKAAYSARNEAVRALEDMLWLERSLELTPSLTSKGAK